MLVFVIPHCPAVKLESHILFHKQSYRGELLILLATMLAGIGWIASKLVILEVPGETFVTARFLLASIILLPFCYKQVFALRPKQLLSLCAVGVVLAASIEVWVYAISISNTLSVGAFIMSLAMIIAPFISWILFKVRPPSIFWLTLPITCIGIMLLTLTDGWVVERSQWFFLLSSVLLSLHFVLNKQVLNSVKPLTSICVQLFMIGAVGLIVMLIVSPESASLNSHILFWFAVSTFVATCIRYLSQTLGQFSVKIEKASLIMLLEPIWTLILSVSFLGEVVETQKLIGGGIIILSLFIYIKFQNKPSLTKSVVVSQKS
ncbi:membrane protein [Shewanella algicola]|nr:membrane protein [Shewanella algicola]